MPETSAQPAAPSFDALGVPARLVASLTASGITEPFPIQAATLPDALAGRDVLGRGRTGSGKTIAFSLPLVARLAEKAAPRRSGRPRALVLAPTRELATQIAAVLEPIAGAAGMNVTTVFGGVSQQKQVAALKAGVDVLVACPGRLEDLLTQRVLTLDGIEITVLDEADHMADMGFLPGVTRIMSRTPEQGQRLLFSATLDNGVDKLVNRFLHRPVTHSVDDGTSAVDTMSHAVLEVADADGKREVMEALASGTERRILFVRTKHVAKRIAKQLVAAGIPAADLQGNLSQNARERNLAMFQTGEIKVLVATDVAARGVHVDDITLVVHVDPPTEHKAYLHRSGRTARAGASGTVVTLVLPEQRREVAQMMRAAGITAKPAQVTAQSAAVRDLVGEVAPKVTPAPVAAAPAQQQRPPRAARPVGGSGGRGGAQQRGAGSGGGAARGASRGGEPRRDAPRTSDRAAGGRGGERGAAGRPSRAPSGGSRPIWSSDTGMQQEPSRPARSGGAGGGGRRSTRAGGPAGGR